MCTDWAGLQQRLAPQKRVGNLESAWNSELSPRLSNLLSNIKAFEDHVNYWALSHVQIQLSILQVLFNAAYMCKHFIKTTEIIKTRA